MNDQFNSDLMLFITGTVPNKKKEKKNLQITNGTGTVSTLHKLKNFWLLYLILNITENLTGSAFFDLI
jgi:hypothetical protein